ncbi:MAG: CHAP domain-containing protein [Methanobrevibacter sp.]|nr:CHAP domain-containing protein [Methanobrevibacter sp.]MBO7695170.1 CHAP domain-containing protein [Methanobrevibacter sp.]
MGIYIEDVIKIATDEIGYHEKASNYDLDSKTGNSGSNNYTKYSRDLWDADPHFYQGPKQGYDWCTVFYDWCLYQASGKDSKYSQSIKYYTGPYGAGCSFAAGYYKAAGAWYKDPRPGDQIFFGSGDSYRHTGLVEKVDDSKVYTIEGNSENQVRRRSYSLKDTSILGYGRPKYDGDKRPDDLPFVDVKKNAWYYDAVNWAYDNKITAGTDSIHFSPNKDCTRAEVVQMLYSMNKYLEDNYSKK